MPSSLDSQDNELRAIFFYGTLEQNWLGAIMSEIWKDQIYRPYLPLNKKGKIALDIGANIGLVSIYLSPYFERIFALEPSKNHFDALSRNLQANKITNVTPINKALYIKEGKFPFGGPKDNLTMRSLHMATWDKGKSDEEVEATTLEALFDKEKIDRVNLLKLDVEGSEVEILSSPTFTKVTDKVDLIIGERHAWSGRHTNQLVDALKNAGFSYEVIPNNADLFVAKK